MGKMNQLSEREKGKIDAYNVLNLSKRDISRRMRRSVKCITTYLQQGANYGKNYKGRQPAMTNRECRKVIRAASNTFKSAAKLKNELNITASRWTIRRILKKANFQRKKAQRKPPLLATHRSNRLEFCRTNMTRNWSNVWFTDEKRFCLDGPDCVSYYWHDLRKSPVILGRRQCGGGGVMVWAGISSACKTSLCFVEATMKATDYQNILHNHFLPFYHQNQTLVQDNAPVHTARSTSDWLVDHNITTIV